MQHCVDHKREVGLRGEAYSEDRGCRRRKTSPARGRCGLPRPAAPAKSFPGSESVSAAGLRGIVGQGAAGCDWTKFLRGGFNRAAMRKLARLFAIGLLAGAGASAGAFAAAGGPNVVIIYTDDVGYGDVSCYGATRVRTPNVDRLAREGLRFTDAHCPAATCTPSRYALLTGEYAWRRKGARVLPGDANLIVPTDRLTLPRLFREAGYATAVVGKWHLGLGKGPVDWNGEIRPGPLETGFDYAFVIPATGDRVPCVFVENRRVCNLDPADPIRVSYRKKVGDDPTGKEHPELLKMKFSHGHNGTIVNGISRIGFMSGGRKARWKDEEIADTLTAKAVAFIEKNRDRRFFLYFATHDIHVPRAPHPRFVGKTPMGPRGDAIAQMDWCVGRILETLDRLGLAGNTLVVFSSDNGPVLDDGYQDRAVELAGGHKPAGPFRGGKYSAFEGGTRVPMIVRWPGHARRGVSDALVSHVDMLASMASLLGRDLPANAGADSFNALPALLGRSRVGRTRLVEQGGAISLRDGLWKYIPPHKGSPVAWQTGIETGNSPRPQLYNLAEDIGERRNLAEARPEKAKEMAELLTRLRSLPRTRP